MSTDVTRPGKHVLTLEIPVMPAAGTFGFGDVYRDLIKYDKLGAFVTNPVTYAQWTPAHGPRVVPLPGGVLLHTGHPNAGISKVMAKYRNTWDAMPMPVVLHILATSVDDVRKCASRADAEAVVDAIELGIDDDTDWQTVERMVSSAVKNIDKPVLVRVPSSNAVELAQVAADHGAGAIVACAPPKGLVRDPLSGQLVRGRLYGTLVKPTVLRIVERLAEILSEVPIIGAGGIHDAQDARDYLECGARAVQIDSITWIDPSRLELIARDLGGLVLTREIGALADQWHPGKGETEREAEAAAAARKLGETRKLK
jgi:dihydroorotate dehydrogenase (NAD+) catalytic subunit